MLEKLFKLKEHQTTVKVELVAGLTTFLTMAYILFANPDIMSAAGMPKEAVFTATAVAAALGCILMGLWANFPAGLAPGMGLNAFFAFAVVGGMGYTWGQALAAVFVSGIIFFLLSAFKIREWILHSIPGCLRHGITVGIGLFLTIIGLKNAGIIADHPATLLTLGDLASPGPMLAGLGLLLIIAFDYRKVPGSIVIGMIAISVIAAILGITQFHGLVGEPHSMSELFLAMDFSRILEATMISVVLAFVFVDLFDTSGTLMATASKAGLTDKDGKFDAMGKAMLADSTATTAGAALGVSSVTTYVESGAGIAAGGKTGLTAVTVGALFLVALFFTPLLDFVPAFATAPALIYVGLMMTADMRNINWDDMTSAAPAWICAIMMPFGFSISHGIGLGFLAHTVLQLLTGKTAEIRPAVALVSVLYVAGIVFGVL
ncbi:guanine permease [Oleiphilus sp. HI0071]|uniref:NCS2 family permease n=2 Tax=Oleiphilus TaxID=141450 RepID=UPI0007C39A36|nr:MULTISPECIES: NCS2 family permease [unclassified Oleiphilus]KZY62383.1 guanine permease [Oleiphilus sp. HI0065]KZY82950.1 guanine permease [Oleiphilus sp. HI0071]KZZ03736.1 guanine permease [Oleiphilus sp. HI0073]KZZ40655.1 guanine permease [Oleiphilus sp. HI0118]KZZ51786.1 guanine permease [Oleiphilus sp. HI0122]KZZ82310.1 guanine permease [Oleiphilus sp. HI0133]